MEINEELREKIGVELPAEEFESLRYHSSYQPQDSSLLKRNKQYARVGEDLVKSCFGVYLYLHGLIENQKQFSSMVNSSIPCMIIEDICQNYSLEDLVVKSFGEESVAHPDIASKIIFLIYTTHGVVFLYDFLKPFMRKHESSQDIDYKTIAQEYAQKGHILPTYTLIEVTGPEHNLQCTTKISVGNMMALGTAIGKKNSEKVAAKNFVEKYRIDALKKKVSKDYINYQPKYSLFWLEKARSHLSTLGIPQNAISPSLIEQSFTHASYLNLPDGKGAISNNCLDVLGAIILQIYCATYLLENLDDLNQISSEKTIYLSAANIANVIPFNWLTDMKSAMKHMKDNTKEADGMKIDLIESICASLWISCILKQDKSIVGYAKNIAYALFKKSRKDAVLDYSTAVRELIAKSKGEFAEDTSQFSIGPNNEYTAKSTVTVKINGSLKSSIGFGRSNKEAINNACKELIPVLIPEVQNDENLLNKLLKYASPEVRVLYANKIKPQDVKPLASEQPPTEEKKTTSPYEKEIKFYGGPAILYVFQGTLACRKKSHHISSATGIVKRITGSEIKLNVNYCAECKRYFINMNEYKYYREIYGALMGRFDFSTFASNNSGFGQMAEESILHLCGYTVNQQDALSSTQRHMILRGIIENGIMAKYRVMEYLQFFINRSVNIKQLSIAREKWEEDLQWVRDYKLQNQPNVIINVIKKK